MVRARTQPAPASRTDPPCRQADGARPPSPRGPCSTCPAGRQPRSLTPARPATHPTRSSKTFHSAARTPPGARTPAISGPATAMSNQCIALPASTASMDPSGSGIPSALPAGRGQPARPDAVTQHRQIWFDRDDLSTELDERGSQLAGPGTEVEQARPARGVPRPVQASAPRGSKTYWRSVRLVMYFDRYCAPL